MDPYVGEVRIFAGNFAPRGWATCDGQLLSIAQNTALFSLLGTTYGGNGTSNFALPNFQNRVPLGQGQGPGLTDYVLGETGGSSTVTVLGSQLPAHQHVLSAGVGSDFGSPSNVASGNLPSGDGSHNFFSNRTTPTLVPMGATTSQGGGQPHNNLMPYLGILFIVALQGVYPPRN